jgi:hypothetical protein
VGKHIGAGCADVAGADDGNFTHLLRQFDLVKKVGNQEIQIRWLNKLSGLHLPDLRRQN